MFKDKICVVTGAASGIGLALSEALTKEDASVIMVDINEELVSKEAKRLNQDYIHADLTKQEDNKRVIEKTIELHDRIDILINIAGIQYVETIEEFPEEKWNLIIKLMLTSPFLLIKYAWPYMKQQEYGRIINLNSIHGLVASEFKAAYVSAKHGLMGLTKVAAMEGGPYNITVNSINPAYVSTPLAMNQIADQARTHDISEEEVIETIMLSKASIKKMIDPKDLMDVVRLFVSPAGNHITGIALPVDGGWTAN